MIKSDQEEFYQIYRLFFIRFTAGFIYFFFCIYFAATIGAVKVLQPIAFNPLLLVFTVITCSFGYASLLWDREMRKFQRRL